MSEYVVKQGDCFLSIAEMHGIPWIILWDYPPNASLKAQRKHPTVLYPGDKVQLPDQDGGKEVPGSTEAKHRFQKIGNEAKLRLRLLERGKPLANKKCQVTVDGVSTEVNCDAEGMLEVGISPLARDGILKVEGDPTIYELKLGWLDPVDQVSGLQARLNQLGFPCGEVDDDYGSNTRTAMKGFQESKTIPPSEEPNTETRAALEQEYGY